jgi:predicted phosphodiesterase
VVVVHGDTQSLDDNHRQIVAGIMSREPAVVFHVGDLVEHGHRQKEWDRFLTNAAPILAQAEFFPALGNHDDDSPTYFEAFDLPDNERWYSVDRIGVHFIVVDTNWDLSPGSEQYLWLEQDLLSAQGACELTVVVMHHSLYCTAHHPVDEKGLRPSLVPLFERSGVDVVFSGHDHVYERSQVNGVVYVVTGGGGANLYPQTRSSPHSLVFASRFHFCELFVEDGGLRVRAIDRDGHLVDDFVVASSGE